MPIPEPVKPLLKEYLTMMESELPGLLTGFYLHGSIALDAFDPCSSDVDFIAVVSRPCNACDAETLASIHAAVRQKYPQPKLQGSYLQPHDLGQFMLEPHPRYSDGRLQPDSTDDGDSVTWWLLKHRGVTALGADPTTLDFTVDWDVLVARMKVNLNTYWRRFTREPARMLWLLSDYGIQWAVLGVLRQFYTFSEGDITSKIGAGEYGLTHLPSRWHRLIREALNIRQRSEKRLYRVDIARAVEAVLFLRFVIRECNRRFG